MFSTLDISFRSSESGKSKHPDRKLEEENKKLRSMVTSMRSEIENLININHSKEKKFRVENDSEASNDGPERVDKNIKLYCNLRVQEMSKQLKKSQKQNER